MVASRWTEASVGGGIAWGAMRVAAGDIRISVFEMAHLVALKREQRGICG